MDGKSATNKYILLVNRLFATTGGTLKRVFQCEAMMPDSFCADLQRKRSLTNVFYRAQQKYLENMLKAFLNSWILLRICQSVFCQLIFSTIIEMLLAKWLPLTLLLSLFLILSLSIFANFSQFIQHWKGLFMWIPVGSLVNCAILKRKLLILIIFWTIYAHLVWFMCDSQTVTVCCFSHKNNNNSWQK